VRVQAFVNGVISEMKRVTWPTREEWVTATLLTLGLVIVVGLYTAAADHLFGWLVGLVTGNTTR
jgi:preprotein translocase SecE subunit